MLNVTYPFAMRTLRKHSISCQLQHYPESSAELCSAQLAISHFPIDLAPITARRHVTRKEISALGSRSAFINSKIIHSKSNRQKKYREIGSDTLYFSQKKRARAIEKVNICENCYVHILQIAGVRKMYSTHMI